MRPLLELICVAALLPTTVSAAPEFAPNPKQAFDGFVAINPPRTEVPVGALWIDHFGPTGDGASKDNLETIRSLNALTIDKNFQLNLSLGLLQLLGIDPRARDHYVARFTDLSLVRVKSISGLSGVQGEPRIVEALKAGSVTVSSDMQIGFNGQNLPWQRGSAEASGTADRAHTYSIEAHDVFIAIHVATPAITQSKEQSLKISDDGSSARIDDFLIAIRPNHCAQPPCKPQLGVVKINTQMPSNLATTPLGPSNVIDLVLPVPISDGQDGLYTKLTLHWIPPCSEVKNDRCGKSPRLTAHFDGTRLHDLPKIEAKGW